MECFCVSFDGAGEGAHCTRAGVKSSCERRGCASCRPSAVRQASMLMWQCAANASTAMGYGDRPAPGQAQSTEPVKAGRCLICGIKGHGMLMMNYDPMYTRCI